MNCGGRNLDQALQAVSRHWRREEVPSVSAIPNKVFRGHGRRKDVTQIADKQEVGKGQHKFLEHVLL